MIDEWVGGVAKEVDFVQEARSQARVTTLLAQNRASIIVPALHPALGASAGLVSDGGGVVSREGTRGKGTQRLLVMEFIDGQRLTDVADKHLQDEGKIKLMESLIAAYAQLMLVDGVFQADPHPGNLLLTKGTAEGEWLPVLLDFGLTKYMPTHARRGMAKWVLAVEAMDIERMKAAMAELGMEIKPGVELDDSNMEHTSAMFGDVLPGQQQREETMKRIDRMRASAAAKGQRGPPMAKMSGHMMLFMRSYMLLRGMASGMNVKVPVMEHMAKGARLGLAVEG